MLFGRGRGHFKCNVIKGEEEIKEEKTVVSVLDKPEYRGARGIIFVLHRTLNLIENM